MAARVCFSSGVRAVDPAKSSVLVIGQLKHLSAVDFNLVKPKFNDKVSQQAWEEGLSKLSPTNLDSIPVYFNYVTITSLPAKVSRHNTSSRAHSIAKSVKTTTRNILIVCERSDVYASGCAVASSYPLYNMKTGEAAQSKSDFDVNVEFLVVDEEGGVTPLDLTPEDVNLLQNSCASIQLTSKIVDMPCNEMNTTRFVAEVRRAEEELAEFGVTSTIIEGKELKDRGFGGIYGVGKAAAHPPALAVLKFEPAGAQKSIAWVGKGIVYDTGGLSMKTKLTMPGMKVDCGGAAAILGAFIVAVKSGFKDNLYALLCLAENSVGPAATRPDDVHTMYSGKTVEINNTDAEGRLVLADGVVYASRDLKADIILDMATLTGAQGVATGKYHAQHLSNDPEWEDKISAAGRASGDLSFPGVYTPEFHFSEFNSAVADMKNSAANRSNALSSCAGLFINSHLGFDFPGAWMHVDMAGPVQSGERATGYGVALLNTLFGDSSSSRMLQSIAPVTHSNGHASQVPQAKKMRLN